MSTPDFGRPRVTVLWHSDLRRDTSGHYLIKEVWGWYLEKALAPSAHKVTIVASLARSGDARFQEYMLTHPVFSVMPLTRDRTKTGLRRTFGNLRDVTAAVRDADVVWVFMPAWKGVYGAAVARLLRRPVVSYFGCEWVGMGDAGRMSNAFRGVGQRAVVALSERILVADEHQLSRYESQRPGRVLRRAPAMLVSPSEIWRRSSYELPERPTILFVGSVDRIKGIDVLLDSARILICDRRLPVRFQVVGPVRPAAMDQLGSQIAEMGIEDSVEFVGYVRNGPRLFDLMKKADVLALPSRSEGFPRVLYEAMAHGLPIVASRVGSIDSVMHHAEDCMLVQPGDPLALADALERLVRDEALRRLVAEQGYRTFDRETRTSAPDQVAAVMLQVTRGQGS